MTRAVRAIAICKEKQTILQCGKEVALIVRVKGRHRTVRAMVMTKEKQTT